jgi:2-polyprenyl-6-methoxyphenol hydroxylase-like FAD-dependent oxidoreductase
MMMPVEKALVIGGGIGGLTAAIALRQIGIEVDLVEIQSDWTVYGVGIIQPNNTLRALDKIGLAQACVDRGGAFPGWRLFDAQGNALFDAAGHSEAAPQFPPNNGITRPILHQLLCDMAADIGVLVRLGLSVKDFDQTDASVGVTFTDGTTGRYHLVIAADGLYSQTRQKLFPDAPAPHFNGQGVWRYNLPRPASMEWGEVHSSAHTKVGLVPMSPALMYMFIVTDRVEIERDDPTLADTMRAHLHEFTGPIADLAKEITDPKGVVYRPMESILLEPRWHQGRIVLIGDAVHATTPHLAQGAAMAIEDAVLLSEMLSDGGELDDILTRFTARRLPRVRYVLDSSLQIAAWEMEQWAGITNPDANPGMLLGQATHHLMEAY